MRILVAANVHRPLHTASGGMELSALDLVRSLAGAAGELGWEIAAVAHPDTVLPPGVALVPATVPECPEEYEREGEGRRKWTTVAGEAAMQRALERCGGFDLVHDHSETVSAVLACARAGVPCARTMHLMPFHPAYAAVAQEVVHCVHISEYQGRMDRWHSAERRSVIRDLVPVEATFPRVAPAGWAVSIGRVERRKGHHLAARIARRLGWRLRVAGSVLDPAYARELAEMPGVELVGELPRSAALELMAGAEALLWCPAVREPGGRVVLEALRLGTPVVGRRIGYLADIAELPCGAAEPVPDIEGIPFGEGLVRVDRLPPRWMSTPARVAHAHHELYRRLIR
jgi:glycosyltransferase involved in cell wall biosynthesis